jgi:uncharacterized protein YbbK (DUF523 family)
MSASSSPSTPPRVRIGISACLLGEVVRYDGGHKRDDFLADVLGRFVDWVPVCPEVEMGLGTPRPPMRLVRIGRAPEEIRLIVPETGDDHTAALRTWAERRVEELATADLDGYILKSDSPSCGLEGVKLYRDLSPDNGVEPTREARGLFAEALLRRLPDLPVEDEGRLRDPLLRESFISRVFLRHRRRQARRPSPQAADTN